MKLFVTLFLLLCLVLRGVAEDRNVFVSGFLPAVQTEQGYVWNPAAFVLLDSLNNGSLSFRYGYADRKSLYSLFEGDGGYAARVGASGYRVIPGRGAYSGAAAWESGVERDVRWTNVRDVELLYPYLVADSIGGDYHYERYSLEGSWAVEYKRGLYGLRGRYRGEVGFRLRDPRPRNTVSELTLNPGALWRWEKWYAGAFFNYCFYRQHLTTGIEEPNRKHRFFVLKGMGLYDYRFSTVESSFSRYYRSHEYQAGIQIGQLGNGISGDFSYTNRRMEVEESDYRKPFLLGSHRMEVSLKWKQATDDKVFVVKAKGGWTKNTGTERSFEQVKPDEENETVRWRLLSESEKFEEDRMYGNLYLLMQHRVSERQIWWYGVDGTGSSARERYLFPVYEKRLADVKGEVNVGFRRMWEKRGLDVNLWGGYKRNLNSSLSAPEAQQVVDGMLLPEYEFGRRSYGTARLRLEYRMPFYKRMDLSFYSDTAGSYVDRRTYRLSTEAGVTLVF